MLSPPLRYAIAIGGTLLIGIGSGLSTQHSVDTWYATLEKPSFNPANWLFAPVWTLLYIAMGIAAARVWVKGRGAARETALRTYCLQLFLNAAWSILFFALQRPAWALVDIVLLLSAIVVCMLRFRPIDRTAMWLLLPYAAWVCFATLLNASIVALN